MISDLTIQQLQEAVQTKIIADSEGNEFSTRPVHLLPPEKFSQPQALRVATLTGFADYIKNHEKDGADPKGILIHVASHKEVYFISPLYGPSKQRDYFIVASFEELLGKSFSFGIYYDHESFVVAMQTLFVDTPERAQVLRVIGTIKEESVREHSDDGVTQSVTAKAGVALVKEIPVPNPVELRPWRTFREIEQPPSEFVLRVRSAEGAKPQCALFEADGGAWKLDAIEGIAFFLKNKIQDIPIIA